MGAKLPVVDGVPQLNVEQVCEGIAQQGGVTFHNPAIAEEKKKCLEDEQAVRDELAKQWPNFMPADKTSCVCTNRRWAETPSWQAQSLCSDLIRGKLLPLDTFWHDILPYK